MQRKHGGGRAGKGDCAKAFDDSLPRVVSIIKKYPGFTQVSVSFYQVFHIWSIYFRTFFLPFPKGNPKTDSPKME